MSLDVKRLELGPFGTNCYVVRRPRGATKPSSSTPAGRARPHGLEEALGDARCAAILITHAHYDHIGGVAELAAGTGAPVHMAEVESERAQRIDELYPESGVTSEDVRAGRPAGGRTSSSTSPGSPSRRSTSRATRRATSPSTPTARSSPATFSSPARSAAPTCRTATGTRCSTSIRRLLDRFPPETVVYPGHGPATTLGRELATQPVPRRAPHAREVRGPARHARHPARRAAALAARRRRSSSASARSTATGGSTRPSSRTPSSSRARPAQGSDVVHEGDVHVRGPRRPLAHAPARGDRADRARVPRARPPPRAAAAEALHDRADVPLRPPAEGPLPRVLAARRRGDRLRRSRRSTPR